jgi:hypothetical protein
MSVQYPAQGATSFVAGADLSLTHFRFVKNHTVAGQVVLCAAGNAAIGVVQEGLIAGRAVAVLQPPARSKVQAGQTLTAGQPVAAGANGVAMPATAGAKIVGWTESASETSALVTVTLATYGGTA